MNNLLIKLSTLICFLLIQNNLFSQKTIAISDSTLIGYWKYDSTITSDIKLQNAGDPKNDYLLITKLKITFNQSGKTITSKWKLNGNKIVFYPYGEDREMELTILLLNNEILVLSDKGKNELNKEINVFFAKKSSNTSIKL